MVSSASHSLTERNERKKEVKEENPPFPFILRPPQLDVIHKVRRLDWGYVKWRQITRLEWAVQPTSSTADGPWLILQSPKFLLGHESSKNASKAYYTPPRLAWKGLFLCYSAESRRDACFCGSPFLLFISLLKKNSYITLSMDMVRPSSLTRLRSRSQWPRMRLSKKAILDRLLFWFSPWMLSFFCVMWCDNTALEDICYSCCSQKDKDSWSTGFFICSETRVGLTWTLSAQFREFGRQ